MVIYNRDNGYDVEISYLLLKGGMHRKKGFYDPLTLAMISVEHNRFKDKEDLSDKLTQPSVSKD